MVKQLIKRTVLALSFLFSFLFSSDAYSESVDYLFLDSYLFGDDLQQTLDVISWDFATFYLDMSQLSEMLDLSITYNAQSKTLEGWLLSENNPVLINLDSDNGNGSGQVGEQQIKILPAQWRELDNTLYLGVDALKLWFGITADIRTGRLMVNFTTEQEHPRHARLKRQKRYQQVSHRRALQANWPQVNDSWQAITTPNLDVNWQRGLDLANGKNSAAISVRGAMDLLWQSSTFNWSRSQGKNNGRWRLNRTLPYEQGHYYYQAGDIVPLPHPFAGTSQGRGFNWLASKDAQNQLLTRRFEGDAPPGWDVELYRGDVVVAWQAVGENGQFMFEDIPVSFGENAFSVALYGPSGERQQRSYAFANYDLGVLPEQWLPELSLVQSGKTVFFNTNDKPDWLVNSRLSYGLNKQQALRFSYLKNRQTTTQKLLNVELSGFMRRHRYQFNLGKSLNHPDFLASLSSTGKLTDHYDYRFSWRDASALKPTQGQQTTLGVSRFDGWLEHAINLGYNTTPSGQAYDITLALGKSFEQWALSHNLSWQQNPNSQQRQGNFNLQWHPPDHNLQLQSEYHFTDGFQWRNAQLSWRYQQFGYSWQWQVRRDQVNKQHSWQLNIGRAFEHVRISMALATDSQQGTTLALNLSSGINFNQSSTRISHNNQRSKATIEAWAFLDQDFDGVFSPGDDPIPGVRFAGQRHWQGIVTDKQGKVRLDATTNSVEKVTLDPDSLEDPFLYTPINKVKINSHPGGKIVLQFPFYISSEIQGEVRLWDSELQSFEVRGGVPLQLLNHKNQLVSETHSEYDGYFALDKLLPGQYRIIVKADYLVSKGLVQQTPRSFSIDNNNAGQLIELPPMLLRAGVK